jgi:hypothetical protein
MMTHEPRFVTWRGPGEAGGVFGAGPGAVRTVARGKGVEQGCALGAIREYRSEPPLLIKAFDCLSHDVMSVNRLRRKIP